jgi:hypothetical protein
MADLDDALLSWEFAVLYDSSYIKNDFSARCCFAQVWFYPKWMIRFSPKVDTITKF